MSFLLQGRKRGMMQVFDEKGDVFACTVIELEKNVITQIKTMERDGYSAVQMGFENYGGSDSRTQERRVKKPQLGHFKKSGVAPKRYLCESRVETVQDLEVGQEFGVDYFESGERVDVTSTSKGKGYQGVVKLHGFSGISASHGAGPVHRHAGSTGNRSTPGRCFPGSPRASQMGNRQVMVSRLRVYKVDASKGILLLIGSVPGSRNAVVKIRKTVKKIK